MAGETRPLFSLEPLRSDEQGNLSDIEVIQASNRAGPGHNAVSPMDQSGPLMDADEGSLGLVGSTGETDVFYECHAPHTHLEEREAELHIPPLLSLANGEGQHIPSSSRLEERYSSFCANVGIVPPPAVVQALANAKPTFSKAVGGGFRMTKQTVTLPLAHMSDAVAFSLADFLSSSAGNEGVALAVDASSQGAAPLGSGGALLHLLRSAGKRLRAVELSGMALGRDTFRDLFHHGLLSHSLALSHCRVRKLDLVGPFPNLRSLVLDHNASVTFLPEGCFRGTPLLASVSLCATGISNPWAATAALAGLPLLRELRFQRCGCCPASPTHCAVFSSQLEVVSAAAAASNSGMGQGREGLTDGQLLEGLSSMVVDMLLLENGGQPEVGGSMEERGEESEEQGQGNSGMWGALSGEDEEEEEEGMERERSEGGIRIPPTVMRHGFEEVGGMEGEPGQARVGGALAYDSEIEEASGAEEDSAWGGQEDDGSRQMEVVDLTEEEDEEEGSSGREGDRSAMQAALERSFVGAGAEGEVTAFWGVPSREAPVWGVPVGPTIEGETGCVDPMEVPSEVDEEMLMIRRRIDFEMDPDSAEKANSAARNSATVAAVGSDSELGSDMQCSERSARPGEEFPAPMLAEYPSRLYATPDSGVGALTTPGAATGPAPFLPLQDQLFHESRSSTVNSETRSSTVNSEGAWSSGGSSATSGSNRSLSFLSGGSSRSVSVYSGESSAGPQGGADLSPELEGPELKEALPARVLATAAVGSNTVMQLPPQIGSSSLDPMAADLPAQSGDSVRNPVQHVALALAATGRSSAPYGFPPTAAREADLPGAGAASTHASDGQPGPQRRAHELTGFPRDRTYSTTALAAAVAARASAGGAGPAGVGGQVSAPAASASGDGEGASAGAALSRDTERVVAFWRQSRLHHSSPICLQQHYREFLLVRLPRLEVLDNLAVTAAERERAWGLFAEHFEPVAYGLRRAENMLALLRRREMQVAHPVPASARRRAQLSRGRAGTQPGVHRKRPQQQGLPTLDRGGTFIGASDAGALPGRVLEAWPSRHGMQHPGGEGQGYTVGVSGEDRGLAEELQGRPREEGLAAGGPRRVGGAGVGVGAGVALCTEARRGGASAAGFRRVLGASRVQASSWLSCRPMTCSPGAGGLGNGAHTQHSEHHRRYRPRQFEYHPTDPHLMVFGTLHGEVVVVNHEAEKIVGQVHSIGAPHSILGLCWLNKDPSKLIGGCDNGSIQLYDINHMRACYLASLRRSQGPGGSSANVNAHPPPPPPPALVGTGGAPAGMPTVHQAGAGEAAGWGTGNGGLALGGAGLPGAVPHPSLGLRGAPLGGQRPGESAAGGMAAWGWGSNVRSPAIYTYEDFEQLTSVHVNCTDDVFVASGYSNHVGLYDLRTGKRLHVFPNLHQEHINVLKFSHHSPYLFATSSFDRDIKLWDARQRIHEDGQNPIYSVRSKRGNVMVCFSPDDNFLLASAIDNEVHQYLASDGRLHMTCDIAPVGSQHNYTRSYYMNGRDYIVSGSCEENVVRICCARTGRRLRDVVLEGKGGRSSLYVQSLRGDPFRDFHLSVLVAYSHPNSRSEIVKVNLVGDSMSSSGPFSDPQDVPLSGIGA